MKLILGAYTLYFENGGLEVKKDDQLLYFNHRPIYVSVKDYGGMMKFRDIAYENVAETARGIEAEGRFTTDNGSVLFVRDLYTLEGTALKIARKVLVEKVHRDDLAFQTKIFFYQAVSDDLCDFNYFSPGMWYRQNEFAASYAPFKDKTLQYYYRKETNSGIPMFAMQHIASGETIAMSRWAPCETLPSHDRVTRENYAYIDAKTTVGSFGASKAKPEALTYTYYGHVMATPLPNTQCDGVAIDYVYPAVDGQQPVGGRGPWNVSQPLRNITWVHPMRLGFMQDYALAVTFNQYPDFNTMMKMTWREAYVRLKDRLYQVDNGVLFNNMMRFLKEVTRQYGSAWGTPFIAQLPDFDPNSLSAEIGFVGQQTGVGYQLLRWGVLNNDEEAIEKGLGILNFWVHETMTETGCPKVWLHLAVHEFEPQPQWIRQLGDGLEAILDAYVFEKKRGVDHPDWLDYCVSTADWLVRMQNEDGSYYRSYNYDNTMCMDSKASTPCIIRFLVQMQLVTGKQEYLDAAIKAGAWTYDNMYLGFEYRGGTCDNMDILDKESGIYCMFGFMALYDVTGEARWLEAACGAADYVETYTFVANFPVACTQYPCHPFTRTHITGQSSVVAGTGGGDVYMAACAYVYYRLYLLTGDEQYCDFAEFIHLNVKQANDIDGSCGYKYVGLIHEGGGFTDQQFQSGYYWLPWCTFVEVDPASRFFDTFGAYDVADIQKLPMEERLRRNRIYDDYAPAK